MLSRFLRKSSYFPHIPQFTPRSVQSHRLPTKPVHVSAYNAQGSRHASEPQSQVPICERPFWLSQQPSAYQEYSQHSGFHPLMKAVFLFATMTFLYKILSAEQREIQERDIIGPTIPTDDFILDANDFAVVGMKPNGRLSGAMVVDRYRRLWIEKGACSEKKIVREMIVSEIYGLVYEMLGYPYPRTRIKQTKLGDGRSKFTTLSEKLPNTVPECDLEKFLQSPNALERLQAKPLKGLGLCLALERAFGKQDIKFGNMILLDMGAYNLVLPIDHEDVFTYVGHLMEYTEPPQKTLEFIIEFNPAESIYQAVPQKDAPLFEQEQFTQFKQPLRGAPIIHAVKSLLLKSIIDDRNDIAKTYEILSNLDCQKILNIVTHLQSFIGRTQIVRVQRLLLETQDYVQTTLFNYANYQMPLDSRFVNQNLFDTFRTNFNKELLGRKRRGGLEYMFDHMDQEPTFPS